MAQFVGHQPRALVAPPQLARQQQGPDPALVARHPPVGKSQLDRVIDKELGGAEGEAAKKLLNKMLD